MNASGKPSLTQRLLEVNKVLGWVEKGGKNKEQGYNYVQAVDIFADARAAYNAHGVIFQSSVTEQHVTIIPREGKATQLLTELKGEYVLINADDKNDVIAGTWAGHSLDVGDKGTWKAITGGLKYVLIGLHLLPTGDDPENDGAVAADPKAAPIATPARDQKQKAETPAATTGLNDKQIAKLKVTLREAGLGITESQRYVLNKLTGKHSSKQMTNDDLDKVLTFFAEKTDENQALVIEAMAHASEKAA